MTARTVGLCDVADSTDDAGAIGDHIGAPLSIQPTIVCRSASEGLGPVPIGNCAALGVPLHPDGNMPAGAVPQRILAAFAFTTAYWLKSCWEAWLPGLWHETQ